MFRNGARTGCWSSDLRPKLTTLSTYARSKMDKKGLDMVVANDITKEGAGFDTDTNIATILTNGGRSTCQK